jgi:hypothetical protein
MLGVEAGGMVILAVIILGTGLRGSPLLMINGQLKSAWGSGWTNVASNASGSFTSLRMCTGPAQLEFELGKAGAAEKGKKLMSSRACEEFTAWSCSQCASLGALQVRWGLS